MACCQALKERQRGKRKEKEGTNLGDDVVEDGGDVVDGDGLESHTEDTVELGGNKGDTGLGGGLSKGLVEDVEASNGEDVGGEESLHGTASVLDGEGRSVDGVGGRGGRVVLVVTLAGDVALGASRRGDPEVGGSSVEDDEEILAGGSEGDGSVVLGLQSLSTTTTSLFWCPSVSPSLLSCFFPV